MKKLFAMLLTIGLFFSINTIANASEVEIDEENFTFEVVEEPLIEGLDEVLEVYGLTEQDPEAAFTIFGVSRPTSVWNVSSKGQYNFSGTSNSQTLYTNYKFKGKTSYTIKVNNNGSKELQVKAKRLTKTYASTKIGGGKSATIQFSSIKKDTEFYITFDGSNQNFSGNIK